MTDRARALAPEPASAATGAGGVSTCIVTYNSERQVGRCLDALAAQTHPPIQVLLWDNASADRSVAVVEARGLRVERSPANVGFARAANELIRRAATPYVLLLNPDVYLRPDYVARLVAAADADPSIGSVTGKLVRPAGSATGAVLDSTGHVLCRNRVPVNRGSGEVDRGQYDAAGEVFGVCAAAALYRHAMLEDVRVGGDYFEAAFFAYLEDVDLDWRARLRGWRAHYVPGAVAEHERGHQGDRRRHAVHVARHSLQNRYLMILRNDRAADLLPDAGVLAVSEALRFVDYAVTRPAALTGYVGALRLLRHVWATRQEIQGRRRVDGAAVRRWLAPFPFAARLRQRFGREAPGPQPTR